MKPVKELSWAGALTIARERSPRIEEALRRIARADALVSEAAALAYPRLDARASYVRFLEAASFRGRTGSDVSGSTTRTRFVTGRGSDIYTGGFDVSYPLFDGGSVYYGREAAAAARSASEADADRVLNELELRVSETFLNVVLAGRAIRIAEDALGFSKGEEKRARVRAEAGEGLKVDALRFATRASEERLALNRAIANRTIEVAALGELLGVRFAGDVEFVEPKEELDLPAGDMVALALATRPELRTLRAQREETEQRLAQEGATWWPALNLFGSYGFISLDSLKLNDDKDELLVGGNLEMNLFEGGATIARMAALRNEAAAIESQERDLALAIEREVRQITADLDVARENVSVSTETVRLAEEVLEQVTAQYRAGEANVIDVTAAQLDRTRAQLAFVTSRVNLLRAQARLRNAVGLGVFRDEKESR
jgi:outer membrane protein TolC